MGESEGGRAAAPACRLIVVLERVCGEGEP